MTNVSSELNRLMERLEVTGLGILGAMMADNKGKKAEEVAASINSQLDYLEWLRINGS